MILAPYEDERDVGRCRGMCRGHKLFGIGSLNGKDDWNFNNLLHNEIVADVSPPVEEIIKILIQK